MTEAGRDELLQQMTEPRPSQADATVAPPLDDEPAKDTQGPEFEARGQAAEVDASAHPSEPVEEQGTQGWAATRIETANRPARAEAVDPPVRVAHLLTQAPLVADCEGASVWSREGRLQLERGSLLELLMYVAASPLLEQGSPSRWRGVSADTVLDEVWSPRARDARNRESGQTWLRKTLTRVQSEVGRLAGGIDGDLIIECEGNLRLNPAVAVSDVEAFLKAVELARTTRGNDQLQAAEEAVVLRPPALLPDVPREGSANGRKFQIYGWLDQPDWERAAPRLNAFGLEALHILGRAYRDAGQQPAAMMAYGEMLGQDPLDRRAQEGLLSTAAGSDDPTQLADAWQQVCACLGRGRPRAARPLRTSSAGDEPNSGQVQGHRQGGSSDGWW